MQVWSFEADQIQPDDLLRSSDIVTNDDIEEFLQNKKEASKFFLVAPKGLGKTLILKLKSKSIRDEGERSYKYIPSGPLVEKVIIEHTSLSQEDFAHFEKFSVWHKIWKMCLTLTICRQLGYKLPSTFELKLKAAKDISPILNLIINDWKFFLHKSHQEFAGEITPLLREIQSQVAVFIDSFDQTLGHLIRGQNYSYTEERKRQMEVNFWANAQLGLLYAIHEICVQHRHIKIFASIRQEAFEMDESDMHLQIDDFATKVKYSKEQLRQIFINNIERTESSKLTKPFDRNPLTKFFGFEKIPHSFVSNYYENVFDFVYRHTFGRPRELVLIGKRIYEMQPDIRNIKSIREKVNRVSHHEIFEQFKKEIIPTFNERRLKIFLSDLKYNVFTKEDAGNLNESQFRFYYKLGLIGALKKDFATQEYFQEFREANKFNYKVSIDVPNSDFYFTHPAMDDLLVTQLNKQYHELNVIGYKYPFIPPRLKKSKPKKLICSHFGAGNLGRGLVLPYLNKMGCQIALINRVSENWRELMNKDIHEVIFSDTSGNESKFKFISDSHDKIQIESILREWKDGKIEKLFLISDDKKLIKQIVEYSNFVTTALKFKDAFEWCSSILNTVVFKRKIRIFPFENDIRMVKSFKDLLKTNKNIDVREVIADRICSDKDIRYTVNPNILNVNTTCENYSLVIVNDKRLNSPFNTTKLVKGLDVQLTKTTKEFEFYHERKLWLFNCIHAILSCYCYNYLRKKNIPSNEWENNYVHILKDIESINSKIEKISHAQIIRLISSMDSNIKSIIYPGLSNSEIFIDLNKYGQDILDRISSNRDRLIRVLPLADFENKYESRIRDLIEFYDDDNKYQALKSLQIFSDENTYREVRKSIDDLKSNLLNLSIDILRVNKKFSEKK